ncbi:hypothetical protein K0M31_017833, partial [Melipona bicolor]
MRENSSDTGVLADKPANRTTGSAASVRAIASRWSYCYDVIIRSKPPLIHGQTRSTAHGNAVPHGTERAV